MNTTVQALQALYVKLGGSLTDTYDNIADGATVADYATIPDMVDAIAQISKAEDCIVGYDYVAGNISTQNNDLLKMFTALQMFAALPGTNTVRAVVMGMQETDGDDYFTLQSYSYVNDNDPESGDITSVTHTVIFASFIPTVAGAKMRFITQTIVTDAPTYEAFDIVSQSATYEEKDIPITP